MVIEPKFLNEENKSQAVATDLRDGGYFDQSLLTMCWFLRVMRDSREFIVKSKRMMTLLQS